MQVGMVRALVFGGLLAALAVCVDHANAPILVPVGSPVNPQGIAHNLCVGDANAMYDEARKQFQLRAQMQGNANLDLAAQETQARAAARRQYVSCLAAQGYRAVYDQ